MAFLLDPLLSESITKLTKLVIHVYQTTANFKPELKVLSDTLEKISSIIQDKVNANRTLDRSEEECKMFRDEIEKATKFVKNCSKVKRNIIKKFTYSLKLKDINGKLLRFFQIEVQAIQYRGIVETLLGVKDLNLELDSLGLNLRDMRPRTTGNDNYMVREKYGWGVPALPSGIVAFDEPLAKLKAVVVAGIDDSSVLVVAGAGGCGKTTLVKMLCHDSEIKEFFGENIFFVTVSETPNFMVIVDNLFNPNPSRVQVVFQSNEEAKFKVEYLLNEKVSGRMLLVLDDVWSDSFIDNFPSKYRGCKILVTSRTALADYDVFRLDPLNQEDAKTLFCCSAFNEGKRRPSPVIDDKLVNQMATCCKEHPLTLSVVGRSLNGKDESVWESMLKLLSQWRPVLDSHKDILISLERSFEALDDDLKQCFLDFGLFPEDQKIPISTLLDMWVHLYNHDHDGVDTLAKIFELFYRNLIHLVTTENDLGASVTFCDQQFATQHDLLRELAIHLNSKLPLAQRRRLIINSPGEDMLASLEQVQEPMQARILSISTGESSRQWSNMKVPDVEVLVLNLMSETCTLPHFVDRMQKLKILNITNHGLEPKEIENFHLLGCSYSLTRIRLECVAINTSILALVNLQKVSFIKCKIGSAFQKLGRNTLLRLLEFEIDNCQDLVEFPEILCASLHLKKLSITNCTQMSGFPKEFSNLRNLETLILRSCTKLEKLPESILRLQKLKILDISDCSSLSKLPDRIGKLGGLQVFYMVGCTGLPDQLPPSVKYLSHTHVVCNEESSYQWRELPNVELHLVADD